MSLSPFVCARSCCALFVIAIVRWCGMVFSPVQVICCSSIFRYVCICWEASVSCPSSGAASASCDIDSQQASSSLGGAASPFVLCGRRRGVLLGPVDFSRRLRLAEAWPDCSGGGAAGSAEALRGRAARPSWEVAGPRVVGSLSSARASVALLLDGLGGPRGRAPR